MTEPRASTAELSSVATALVELSKRLSVLAEGFVSDHRDDIAHELFEVERSLNNAVRRLTRVVEA